MIIRTQKHTHGIANVSALKEQVKKRKDSLTEHIKKMRNGKEDHEKNGGDDEEEVEPKPSRKVLQATSILRQYVADLDGPFACKMEAMLSTFGRETRREEAKTMVDTEITDYFTCM
ncbi:hypothetical protein B0H13DRAFT_2283336 [Mycena leptocephala]|nr:hypothetical protein B0H13DRAFT_2283336 [Mycena leptocephala]